MKYFVLLFLVSFVGVPPLAAQQPDFYEQNSEVLIVPDGDKFLRWYGHPGRSYFIQVSDVNSPLAKWNWAPVIEAGNNEVISHEVGGPTKGFYRLKYTSQRPGYGETLNTADFDNDGISNINEIDPLALTDSATDPLEGDSDRDGMLDGPERSEGYDPNQPDQNNNGIVDGSDDDDSDGTPNAVEISIGSDPKTNSPVDRNIQAFAAKKLVVIPLATPPTTGACRYLVDAITDSGDVGYSRYFHPSGNLNDYNNLVVTHHLWRNGVETEVPPVSKPNRAGYHTQNDGYSGFFNSQEHPLTQQGNASIGNISLGGSASISPPTTETAVDAQNIAYFSPGFTFDGNKGPLVTAFGNIHALEDGTSFAEVFQNRLYYGVQVPDPATVAAWGRTVKQYHHWGPGGAGPVLMGGAPTLDDKWIHNRYSHILNAGGMGGTAFFLTREYIYWDSQSVTLRVRNGATLDLTNSGFDLYAPYATGRNGHVAQRQSSGGTVFQFPGGITETLPPAFRRNGAGYYIQVNDYGDILTYDQLPSSSAGPDVIGRKFTDPANGRTSRAICRVSDSGVSAGWSAVDVHTLANTMPLTAQQTLASQTPPAYPPSPDQAPFPLLGGTAVKDGKQYPVLLLPVEVSWKAIDGFDNVDDHIDPWNKPIYGKRIFPDFKNPNESEIQHKLEVIVKTSPALFGKAVFVKAFDVDDSTSEHFDHDENGTTPVIDTNGKAGNDNLIDYLNTPKNGQFWTGSAWGGQTAQGTVDASGETKFIFRVGMQPGSNYRVVASVIDESMYAGVQVTDPAATKYLGPEANQNGDAAASPLLTVWRRLWVENDSMEAIGSYPDGDLKNDLTSDMASPTIQQIFPAAAITTFYVPTISDRTSFTAPENGKFKFPGTADSFTSFQTIPNMSSGIDAIQVAGNQGHIQPGATFRLYDDDGFGLGNSPLPRNDLVDDRIKGVYRPAFIEVMDANSWNDHKTVDFYRSHAPVLGPLLIGGLLGSHSYGVLDDALDAKLEGNENLWCASVIVAYQPGGGDNDPNDEEFGVITGATIGDSPEIAGVTLGFLGRARVSIVYSEVVRDQIDGLLRSGGSTVQEYEQRLRLTAAHEIGHQPLYGIGEAAQHAEDGLMQDGGHMDLGAADTPFKAKSVKRFRQVREWRQKEQ